MAKKRDGTSLEPTINDPAAMAHLLAEGNIDPEVSPEQLEAEEMVKQADEEQEKVREAAIDRSQVHYLECRACHKPGIFFVGNPMEGQITGTSWFSKYKPQRMPWSGLTVPCQECGAQLDFLNNNRSLIPNRRFLRTMRRPQPAAKA